MERATRGWRGPLGVGEGHWGLERALGVGEGHWGLERVGTCPRECNVYLHSSPYVRAEGGHDCAEDAQSCMQLMLKRAHSDHLQSLRARRASGLVLPATASSSAGDTQCGSNE